MASDDENRDEQHPRQVVYTNKARCRDCYRCLRICPVKAIRMAGGQAYVDEERCIACGTCIRECPQGAKQYRHDLGLAQKILDEEMPVAVSLAPSFAAGFTEPGKVPTALRRLGFQYIAETAVGAYHIAAAAKELMHEHPERSAIGSACPAVVRYIEGYRPDVHDRLQPLVSPMIAHGRHLKRTLGEAWRVIFIGPCVAKKAEAERPEYAGVIDCALTFEELATWLERAGIDLAALEPSGFDEIPGGKARLFPVEGGESAASDLVPDPLDPRVVLASGHEEVDQALDDLAAGGRPVLVEPLFCPQGCINGPAIGLEENVYQRRQRLLEYARRPVEGEPAPPADPEDLRAAHAPAVVDAEPVTEEAIAAVFERTGKADPADRLNCGACGYPSCREKAIAVVRGMAEEEMCIPHMRRLAERRGDRIVETNPNGIIILDEALRILSINPAFRAMFNCGDAVVGKAISYLMDPEPFERLTTGETERVDMVAHHEHYGLACQQVLYRLPEEKQLVGIFVDITNLRTTQDQLARIKDETARQARALLEQQMTMAQDMARFLGENTAKSEKLLDSLAHVGRDEEDRGLGGDGGPGGGPGAGPGAGPEEKGRGRCLRDIYTSK